MEWRFQWHNTRLQAAPPDLLESWNAAFHAHGSIWHSPDVIRCWEDVVGLPRGVQPVLLIAENRCQQKVYYPLYIRRERTFGLSYKVIEPLGGLHQCDCQDPLGLWNSMNSTETQAFWREFSEAFRLKFGAMAEFRAYRLSCADIPAPFHVMWRDVDPYIPLDEASNLEEFLRPRGKELREHVTHGLRHLRKHGLVSLQRVDQGGLHESLESFFEMFALQWGRNPERLAFSMPETRRYWTSLAETTAQLGLLHLSAIVVGGDVWSWYLGFEHRGVLLLSKATYNMKFRHCSPGSLHLALNVEDCMQRTCQELDLGSGDEPYKSRWTKCCRPLVAVRIKAPSAVVRLAKRLARLCGRAAT